MYSLKYIICRTFIIIFTLIIQQIEITRQVQRKKNNTLTTNELSRNLEMMHSKAT